MNKKYQKYINYIVNDIEPPYFINMKDSYGLSPDEYEMVLSKVLNQPVTIEGSYVYDKEGNNRFYHEDSSGYWQKWEYDNQGNKIYYGNSNGYWARWEYDSQGDLIYYVDSDGYIEDRR